MVRNIMAGLLLMAAGSARALAPELTVGAGWAQQREPANLGMVFHGGAAGADVRLAWGRWFYEPGLALQVDGRRGMTGYAIDFTPAKGGWEWTAGAWRAGVSLAVAWHWQMWPDLHNAHLFSQGEVPLSVRIGFDAGPVELRAENSLCGLAARMAEADPYVYSLRFGDFAWRPFRGARLMTFGRYDHTVASAVYKPLGVGLAAEFRQVEHYQSLTISAIWRKNF